MSRTSPRTCTDYRAGGFLRLGKARVPEPHPAAPFNGLARTPRTMPVRGYMYPVRSSVWSRALLAHRNVGADNTYYVKLAPGSRAGAHVPGGALAFLHRRPSEHVSSQPRGFSEDLEKGRTEWPNGAESIEPVGQGRAVDTRSAPSRPAPNCAGAVRSAWSPVLLVSLPVGEWHFLVVGEGFRESTLRDRVQQSGVE